MPKDDLPGRTPAMRRAAEEAARQAMLAQSFNDMAERGMVTEEAVTVMRPLRFKSKSNWYSWR
jgi:hypothetical protein